MVDEGRHGTHVTGTFVGNGYVESRYAGMAPGVQHIRFGKVLTHFGTGTSDAVLRAMDFLARPSSCTEVGWSNARAKPLVVNMSLSASGNVFEGRGVDERKLDAVVWSHRQLYVVAQSNEDVRAFSNYGTAKNSLAVGAVRDSGYPRHVQQPRSHGGRAAGAADCRHRSGPSTPRRAGAVGGNYVSFDGTSMAAPSVASAWRRC